MRGLIYDGLSARGRDAVIELEPDYLSITFSEGGGERIPFGKLARGANQPGRAVIHRDDAPDWRLVITEPEFAAPLRRLPPVGRFRRKTMIAYSLASAALIAGAIGLWAAGDPILDAAAQLVPHRVVESMGRAVVMGIGADRQCTNPAGQAALDRLMERLRPQEGFAEPVRIGVADVATVNAFAAPGGQIVVLRGLIDQAKSPDEVAGVIAHEITHVQLRHPTKALIRAFGLSALISAIAGQTGEIANQAILLDGSRNAERAADAGALKLLRGARLSPTGMADFFRRMEGKTASSKNSDGTGALIDRLGSFMASHPGNAERIAAIEAAAHDGAPTTPAMSDDDWKSLRAICASPDRAQKKAALGN